MLTWLNSMSARRKTGVIAFMLTTKIVVIAMLFLLCTSSPDRSEFVLETIHQRTSIRSFTDQAVTEEQLETLLRAAMAAPSSRNVQPWVFYVVDDAATLQHLAKELPFASMAAGAPVAIIVCGDTRKGQPNEEQAKNWIMDCSAASQNLLLAAHAMGLGAVWTGVFPYRDRIDVVRERLNIPEHLVPLNLIPIGHPAESPPPKEKWDPGKVIR